MPDGNDRNDKAPIIDLVNDPVITDADAVCLPAFEFFATRGAGILLQLHHFIFDPGGNGIR